MKLARLWRFGLLGISVGLLLFTYACSTTGSARTASTKEFQLVTGEWKWKAKPGEAPVVDRTLGAKKEIERYVFDPGFIVVNKGDTVVLNIHDVKGSKHQIEIPAFGVKEKLIKRGEEITIRFVANKAGTFKIKCNNHVDATKEGPMEGYIYVLD